ncbi:TPA: hypothetical protein ACQUH6_001992 [Neisseria polysaccharea]|uniref:hypothetical protein n=1 Tax=Neisseria polysaccharea TaxID=489 RepID=UPI0027E17C77|nr:hypothetical protein [Neisseria polysaccharea]
MTGFQTASNALSGFSNGRVGFSPPLQTASNALSGFRRHSGFGGLKPTLPLLTNHPDKPPRQTKPPRLKQIPPTKKQSGTRLTVPDCFQAHPRIKTYCARPY